MLSLKMNTPLLGTALSSGTDVWTAGFLTDLGHRFNFGGTFFVEPQVTLAYAKTNIDNINSLATLGANLNWGNGESFRGALGARVGTLSQFGAYRYEAAVTGRVWDEFLDGNNTVSITGTSLLFGDNFKGTYGELKADMNVVNLGTNWSYFVNASGKFNSDFYTITGKGGVRYQW